MLTNTSMYFIIKFEFCTFLTCKFLKILKKSTHSYTTFCVLYGVIQIPRGWFCYPCSRHIPEGSFVLRTNPPAPWTIIFLLRHHQVHGFLIIRCVAAFWHSFYKREIHISSKYDIICTVVWILFFKIEIFVDLISARANLIFFPVKLAIINISLNS